MKSGYEIKWTNNAFIELQEVFNYLDINWTERESKKLAKKIELTIQSISENPFMFPESKHLSIRKAIIHKLNSIYYSVNIEEKSVMILSFHSNRKNPRNLNF